jgi:hypothetical protein
LPRHLIRRERLIRRLADATEAPVCVIDAPVGFGKSVLIRQFLEAEPREHILYEVAPDASLAGFARGLADALSTRDPGARLSFASAYDRAAQSKQPSAHLAYWLIEHLRDLSLTVVVDGLNDAADDPATMDFLVRLIDGTHEHLHWIVATRSSALLRIPSWMAHGVMERSVDVTELRFDVAELALLAQTYDLRSSAFKRSDESARGWPAGAAFAISRSCDTGEIVTPVDEADYDSLSAQLFAACSANTRAILLSTCHLPEIDVAVTDEIAGDDTGSLFESLTNMLPWMFSLGGDSLRYHDRFKAFLENKLDASDSGTIENVDRVAGALRAKGHIAQALTLLTRFSRTVLMTSIVESHGFALIESGDAEVVGKALAVLDQPADQNPIVMAVRAMLDSRLGRSDTAEAWYRLAIEALKDDPRCGDISYRYAHELVRAYRVDWLDLLRPYASGDDLSDDVLAMRCSLLAQGYSIAGQREAAGVQLRRALEFASHSTSAATQATVDGRAAFIALNDGDAPSAKSYAVRATECAVANGLYDLAAPLFSVLFAIAYDLEDDALASFDFLGQIAYYSIKSGNIQLNLWALAARYGLLMERGDETAAAHINTSLKSFDLHYLSPAFADALLPSQALSAAWRGSFAHAHALLLPSADAQTDSERRALRWAEAAFYAAGAGLLTEAETEATNADREIRRCDEITPRVIRAKVMLAFALLLMEQFDTATDFIEQVRLARPQTTRTRSLGNALAAFSTWWKSDEEPLALSRSLQQLEELQLGGLARALEALPISATRNIRLRARKTSDELR